MNETADCELHFVFLYLTFCEWKRSTVHKDAVFRNISTLTIAMNHINKLLFIYVLRDKCGTLQGFDIQLLAVFFFKSGFFEIRRILWKYHAIYDQDSSNVDHFSGRSHELCIYSSSEEQTGWSCYILSYQCYGNIWNLDFLGDIFLTFFRINCKWMTTINILNRNIHKNIIYRRGLSKYFFKICLKVNEIASEKWARRC